MTARMRIRKGDSADLDFAMTCLTGGVITFDEFQTWLEGIVSIEDDPPSFVFDAMDIRDRHDFVLKARDIIGFWPAWDASDAELRALDGVGYKRFPHFKSDACDRRRALRALEASAHVEGLFRRTFGFIQID